MGSVVNPMSMDSVQPLLGPETYAGCSAWTILALFDTLYHGMVLDVRESSLRAFRHYLCPWPLAPHDDVRDGGFKMDYRGAELPICNSTQTSQSFYNCGSSSEEKKCTHPNLCQR